MKNKILIVIAVLLALFLISVRLIFINKFKEFQISIKNYENKQLADILLEKEKRIAKFSEEGLLELFKKYYKESNLIIQRDTTFSFLYLKRKVKYNTGRLEYLDCLYQFCKLEQKNQEAHLRNEKKEKILGEKYGKTFTIWYPKLKDKIIRPKIYQFVNCGDFFNDITEIIYNAKAWNEFEEFMKTYDTEVQLAENISKQAEELYKNNVITTKNNLKDDVIKFFNDRLSEKESAILTTETITKKFESPTLGVITYNVIITKFNKPVFQKVADAAFDEQWKYNSLRTGSMPYANCYGSDNSCNGWRCSEIRVINGEGEDVVVLVKDSKHIVVRHAYIKNRESFTFNVPDGSYQVFFYSGNGWNPHKEMPSPSCSSLKGGFVSRENVTKDDPVSLSSQILTYELIRQRFGNFDPKKSSINEAF